MDKVFVIIKEMVEKGGECIIFRDFNVGYEGIIEGVDRMVEYFFLGFKFFGEIMYNILMFVFIYNGYVDEVVKLLEVMKKYECILIVVIYIMLVDGLGKVGRLDEVVSLLREMEK